MFTFGPGAPAPEPDDGLSQLSVDELEKALQGAGGKLRFVAPEARHLTLAFLADVDKGITGELSRALGGAVSKMAPFHVGARGVGFFPSAQRPKVIWVGLDDPEHRLAPLHAAVDASLSKVGVQRSGGAFVPHVTIARVVRAPPAEHLARAVDPLVATRFGWSEAKGIEVVESTLTPKGPVYRTLSEHPFSAGAKR